uniref:Uncharacterized protein n=1 Tax=Leersia perrieri TaxID=77586 RepID=A0A0D9VSI1_9ORYZ
MEAMPTTPSSSATMSPSLTHEPDEMNAAHRPDDMEVGQQPSQMDTEHRPDGMEAMKQPDDMEVAGKQADAMEVASKPTQSHLDTNTAPQLIREKIGQTYDYLPQDYGLSKQDEIAVATVLFGDPKHTLVSIDDVFVKKYEMDCLL